MHILSMSMFNYWIDNNATKTHKIKRIRDGKRLINEFFILKWKYWAHIINSPIRTDGIRTNDEYQIPTTSNVAKDIFVAPIKFFLLIWLFGVAPFNQVVSSLNYFIFHIRSISNLFILIFYNGYYLTLRNPTECYNFISIVIVKSAIFALLLFEVRYNFAPL